MAEDVPRAHAVDMSEVFVVNERLDRRSQQYIYIVPQHSLDRGADIDAATRLIVERDDIGYVLGQQAIERLALGQGRLARARGLRRLRLDDPRACIPTEKCKQRRERDGEHQPDNDKQGI